MEKNRKLYSGIYIQYDYGALDDTHFYENIIKKAIGKSKIPQDLNDADTKKIISVIIKLPINEQIYFFYHIMDVYFNLVDIENPFNKKMAEILESVPKSLAPIFLGFLDPIEDNEYSSKAYDKVMDWRKNVRPHLERQFGIKFYAESEFV